MLIGRIDFDLMRTDSEIANAISQELHFLNDNSRANEVEQILNDIDLNQCDRYLAKKIHALTGMFGATVSNRGQFLERIRDHFADTDQGIADKNAISAAVHNAEDRAGAARLVADIVAGINPANITRERALLVMQGIDQSGLDIPARNGLAAQINARFGTNL